MLFGGEKVKLKVKDDKRNKRRSSEGGGMALM